MSPLRSASNVSVPPPAPFPTYHYMRLCFCSTEGAVGITVAAISSGLLLLPLFVFVLFLGLQRWRRRRRSGAALSHSDVLTFHVVFRDLLVTSGFLLTCAGVHARLLGVVTTGTFLVTVSCSGQVLFHLLTCVDRYLAVVHPVTYLSLKAEKGVRSRNVAVASVWLVSLSTIGVLFSTDRNAVALSYIAVMVVNIGGICFCSFSVLRVLVHPGPGEEGGAGQRVDRFRRRALRTMMVILGVLLLVFGGNALSFGLYVATPVAAAAPAGVMAAITAGRCTLVLSIFWCHLPSSAVLPLLFLHRAGKLQRCKTRFTGH